MISLRQTIRLLVFALMVDIAFSANECTGGWTKFSFNNICYKMFPSAKTWFEAKDSCNDEFANIVDIGNNEENEFIAGMCSTEQCWIGSNIITEVHWRWTTGSPNFYENWNSITGSPENKGEYPSSCVYIYGTAAAPEHRGTWNTTDCNTTQDYICLKYPV